MESRRNGPQLSSRHDDDDEYCHLLAVPVLNHLLPLELFVYPRLIIEIISAHPHI